jgi:hypothetical protein
MPGASERNNENRPIRPSVSPFETLGSGWLDGACHGECKNAPALTPGTTGYIHDNSIPIGTEFVAYGTFTYRAAVDESSARRARQSAAMPWMQDTKLSTTARDTSFYEVSLEGIRDLVLTQESAFSALRQGTQA